MLCFGKPRSTYQFNLGKWELAENIFLERLEETFGKKKIRNEKLDISSHGSKGRSFPQG